MLAIIIAAMAYYIDFQHHRQRISLAARLAQIVPVGAQHPEISCAEVAATRPLVLLALGQSNAGNHGSPSVSSSQPLTLFSEGKCVKATDPLPGSTGEGGSIWQRLPTWLSMQRNARPLVLSVVAVEATTIAEWTGANSPLRAHLVSHLASMHRMNMAPDLVLWQQGEADARIGTAREDYSIGLQKLSEMLNANGTTAPIILARSTICLSAPSAAIRAAIESSVASNRRFRLGPDTDALSGERFRIGCHFTAEGLDSAAKMWAEVISTEASTFRSTQ